MSNNINNLLKIYNDKKVEYNLAKRKLKSINFELEDIEYQLGIFEKAKTYILELSKQSQEDKKDYIEYIVTLFLQMVFGESYKAKIIIDEKYDQQEVSFFFDRDGDLIEVRSDLECGGAIDIYSFGLRIAVQSLEAETEPIIFIDEKIFHNVDKKKLPLSASILKKVSEMLDIQIVLITHEEDLSNIADKIVNLNKE